MLVSLSRAVRLAGAAFVLAVILCTVVLQAQAHARFTTGWTHVVPTGGNGDSTGVLFYRQGSDVAVTGSFDRAGRFHQNGTSSGLSPEWTHIVGKGHRLSGTGGDTAWPMNDLLFYNARTGLANTAEVTTWGWGAIRTCRTYAFDVGWTHLVAWKTGRVLLYNDATGQAVTGWLNNCEFHQERVMSLMPGWTNITATGDGRVLFYQRGSGLAATGYIDAGGAYQQQRVYSDYFFRGWTNIVGNGDGDLLFYAKPNRILSSMDGTYPAATGYLDADGDFVNTKNYRFSRWSHVAGFAKPNVAFFYNTDTGTAASGILSRDGFHETQGWL